jgi:hypothetical protein
MDRLHFDRILSLHSTRLSEMSRLEYARETVRLLLEEVEADGLLPPSWSGYWERSVEAKLDPRAGVKYLQAKSAEVGQDRLALWREAGDYGPIAARDAFVLLQRVFLENYPLDPAGTLQATRARPTGAVHNPHEPQAQWSSKSTTKDKSWIGYKVQVAETVHQAQPRERGEPTANFLTAILTQDAPASDKPGLAQVLSEQKDMGLEPPSDTKNDRTIPIERAGQALYFQIIQEVFQRNHLLRSDPMAQRTGNWAAPLALKGIRRPKGADYASPGQRPGNWGEQKHKP